MQEKERNNMNKNLRALERVPRSVGLNCGGGGGVV